MGDNEATCMHARAHTHLILLRHVETQLHVVHRPLLVDDAREQKLEALKPPKARREARAEGVAVAELLGVLCEEIVQEREACGWPRTKSGR